MDENFGGQPNPLNPKPNVAPNTGQELVNNQNQPPNTNTVQYPNQNLNQAQPMTNTTQNIGAENFARPMEKVPDATPAPVKKKKTGLIVGIAVGAVALIGIIIAIILVVMNSGDPVSKAVERVINGEAPENVALNGTIDINSNSDEIGSPSASIKLEAQGSTDSLINTASAYVNLNFKDLGELNLTVSEVYPSNGELYLKIDGVSSALTGYGAMLEEYNNTISNNAENTTTDGSNTKTESAEDAITNTFSSAFEQLDGNWLKISLDDLKSFASKISGNDTDCSANLISDIKNSGNTLAQMYNKNPFISSTTENVTVASKNSKVYQVVFDDEKMNNFLGDLSDTSFVTNYQECTDSETSLVSDINTNELPTFYAELDDEYNFTRFYTSSSLSNDSDTTITADLDISYPKNIEASKPDNVIDFETIMTMFMINLDLSDSNEATLEGADIITE